MSLKKANGADVEKVLAEIEDENIVSLGEVEVEEDGFVHNVPLLAGYVDENGICHKTFTYREMNGKDEEAINKGDVKSNGGKLANILLERCVTEIGTITKKEVGAQKWAEIIRNMLGGDIDYMLVKVREISKGEELTFQHICPHCKAKLDTTINIDELNVTPFNGVWEIPFELPRGYKDKNGLHRTGHIRRLNGLDREIIVPLFKKNVATGSTMLITRLIKFDDGAVVTNEGVANMTVRDRDYLESLISENNFGVDMNVEVTCTNCGADLSDTLGQSNFF